MTRDFIFDGSGAMIGYRCRLNHKNWDKSGIDPFRICGRFFPTARGLWQH